MVLKRTHGIGGLMVLIMTHIIDMDLSYSIDTLQESQVNSISTIAGAGFINKPFSYITLYHS